VHCAWSADSAQLAIAWTNAPEINARFLGTTVAIIPATGGLARELATYEMSPGSLAFATINGEPVLVMDREGNANAPANTLWVLPLVPGSPARNLLPDYPGQVAECTPIAGQPDRMMVRIVEGTHANIYGIDLASGELTAATPADHHAAGSVTAGPSISADGTAFTYIWSDGDRAHEVYRATPGGDPVALTSFGAQVNPRLLPVQQVTWMSDGVEIEGHLTLPAGYTEGTRYPLIVEIHGGPSWQWEDRLMLNWHDWAQLLASHGFAVLAPNPRGSTGRGSAFQKLLVNDVGGGEVRDLITGAEAMVERGIADPDRLGIGGWSWGGYLTATTITRTTMFKAAVMGAGLANLISDHGTDDIPNANLLYFPGHPYHHLDLYWEGSAIKRITECTTPTLIVHGDADDRVPPSQGAEMFRALKVLGVPVQFVRYPREPHAFRERAHQIDVQQRILNWFKTYLLTS
jgi:dipeptidyl aminopeptidase/acylaminoacyl peptidase